MSKQLKVSLPDDLLDFVRKNSGEGTPHATPSDFVCAVLHEKCERLEAAAIREGIIAGLQDAVAGRMHEFRGDLRALMRKVKP